MAAIQLRQPVESPMERALRAGHRNRKGHELVAVLASADGFLWFRVNECCGETPEQRLADEDPNGFADLAPKPATAHLARQE
jgi:hypothetical protein